MTKKDYELIAAVFKSAMDSDYMQIAAMLIAVKLATTFSEDNPKFDPERFLTACGVGK